MTDLQERFIGEYLIDLNATQAAVRAGYSAKTAGIIGFENLRKPKIAEAIDKQRKRIMDKVELTQEEVVRGLRTEAELYGDGASHSARVSAWSHLAKHLGMFVDKLEISGPGGGPMVTEVVIEHHTSADASTLGGSGRPEAHVAIPSGAEPGVAVNGKVYPRISGDKIG